VDAIPEGLLSNVPGPLDQFRGAGLLGIKERFQVCWNRSGFLGFPGPCSLGLHGLTLGVM
jgi:hypothetical protein